MKEKIKNVLLPIAIVLVVVLLAYFVSLVSNKSTALVKNVDFDKYYEVKEKATTSIIFVADSSNKESLKQHDILTELADNYYLDIYNLDYNEQKAEYQNLLKNEQIETSKDSLLLVVKDNKILAKLEGKNDMEAVLNFVDDYIPIINKELIEISVDEYLQLIKNDKLKTVYIARPTCQYCQMMSPVLKDVMEEYRFNVYYLNTDNMTEDDYEKFTDTDESLKEGFGTPMLVYTKDGTFIDVLDGYNERSALVDFLKVNKIINVGN